jgi:dienelactone hydrolase
VSGTVHRSVLALILAALLAGCGGGSHVRIEVDHPVALWDVPLHISVSGLAPNERVVVHASAADHEGKTFTSSTRVTGSAAGRVDLRGDAAMRVLWSIRPAGLPAHRDFDYVPPATGERLTLTVAAARTTIVRQIRAPGVRVRLLRPAASGLYGNFYSPSDTHDRRPGVLVFGGSEGGLLTTGIGGLLASHGYPTLALAYFAEPGLPKNLLRIRLEYFAAALRWLARQPGVDPARLVVEGISRGSEAAQLLGVHDPQLVHAVVAMVPSNSAGCGIDRFTGTNHVHCLGPAWTFRGKPIPYDSPSPVPPYPIPDERIDGPVFLDCGGLDHLWPSCPMARAISSRLLDHHFRHPVTLLDFPNAGHGVGALVPYAPGRFSILEGRLAASNQRADADGWPKLLRFLRSLADS